VIKYILNIFRRKKPIHTQPPNSQVNKESDKLDKSKIVDADFEELK
jgi:hypothetical protein